MYLLLLLSKIKQSSSYETVSVLSRNILSYHAKPQGW